MDPSVISAWARGLERLGIVGLSGLSLILGWDLFRRGIFTPQSADLKAYTWSIRLQRVGPGIFFALFATAVFITAISRPLEITSGKKTEQQTKGNGVDASIVNTEDQTITNEGQGLASTDRDVVTAINTFHMIAIPHMSTGLDVGQTTAIAKADQTLESLKQSLMFQHFGQMSTQFYAIHDQVPFDPSLLSKQPANFQHSYPEIEVWDKDTFLRNR